MDCKRDLIFRESGNCGAKKKDLKFLNSFKTFNLKKN